MIEIRALNVEESQELSKFVSANDKDENLGQLVVDWIIDKIYPELREQKLYPSILTAVVRKTQEMTAECVDEQMEAVIKNYKQLFGGDLKEQIIAKDAKK